MEELKVVSVSKKGSKRRVPKGPVMTKEMLLALSLEDFSKILLGNREERAGLIAGKSPMRGFLFDKLFASTREEKRLSAEDRKKKTVEEVALMFEEMRKDPEFFFGFNFVTGKNDLKLLEDKNDRDKRRNYIEKNKPKHPTHEFSLGKMLALSLSVADIQRLGISVWKMVALHIFGDYISEEKPLHSDVLKSAGPQIYASVVDVVLAKKILDPPLTVEQRGMLSSLLKRDGRMHTGVERMFQGELPKVLVLQTLGKIDLSAEAVSLLTDIPIKKLSNSQQLLKKKEIKITLVRKMNPLDRKVFLACPLHVKCDRVAKLLADGKSCQLSCEYCLLYQRHRLKTEQEVPSFGMSCMGNLLL